ncbi:hypothetical protein BCR36DRAFT_588169 [Piromyces finnis]|uniref:Transglutaminase-like domain-containing protein n=1 Tax=Piromyces finnis TaxID=1754191 RepID=A0A1Y1UQT0_9FUNG|nr:hypothetical protein BCR36DRAFT_588168 [Piromyces finnis]ORX40404.1 hypothetical protein BCR36DRAFT_588169 [Piromyces finnis]|eukprot:ORX40403.1 hypothetical protein BCR36DRAFT_588168 [Piromyces finnis]
MKLFSLLSFALLSVSAVFSAPAYDFCDIAFCYSLKNNKATLVSVRDKNMDQYSIGPYAQSRNGSYKYVLEKIGSNAFDGSMVRSITINHDDQITFASKCFENAPYLKDIILNVGHVFADVDAFDGLTKYATFSGKGVPSLVEDYSKKLLQKWNLPVGKDYTNVSAYTFNKDLFKLAVKVKENFSHYDKVAAKDNVAVVLALKSGGNTGIARAFRMLARTMGYKYNDVHVGGDNGYYNWNYVYTRLDDNSNKKWYNVDILNTNFNKNSSVNSIFRTKYSQRMFIASKFGNDSPYANVDNWIIYVNEYGYYGEKLYSDQITENFYSWLVRNRAGVQA